MQKPGSSSRIDVFSASSEVYWPSLVNTPKSERVTFLKMTRPSHFHNKSENPTSNCQKLNLNNGDKSTSHWQSLMLNVEWAEGLCQVSLKPRFWITLSTLYYLLLLLLLLLLYRLIGDPKLKNHQISYSEGPNKFNFNASDDSWLKLGSESEPA